MTIAFAHFDEPLAWLIRGLITYGWADVTTNRVTPAQVVGGFDLSLIPDSQGKSGLILKFPLLPTAVAATRTTPMPSRSC